MINRDGATPVMNQAGTDEEPGLDLLGLFRRRKWILIGCVVVAAALGVLYLAQAPRIYEATATVQVERAVPVLPVQSGGGERVSDLVHTHMWLIRTDTAILTGAVKNGRLASLPDLKETARQGDLVQVLSDSLVTQRIGRSQLFTVSYRAQNPESARRVVAAVVEAYRDHVKKTQKNTVAQSVKLLTNRSKQIDGELKTRLGELRSFREKNRMLLLGSNAKGQPIILTRITTLDRALAQAYLNRLEAETYFSEVQVAIERGFPLDEYLARASLMPGASAILDAKLQTQIMAVKLSIERQMEDLGRGAMHPKVRELMHRLTVLEAAQGGAWGANPLPPAPTTQGTQTQPVSREELVKLLLANGRERVAQLESVEQRLTGEFDQEWAKAADVQTKQQNLVYLGDEIKRLRKSYSVIDDQLKQLDLTKGEQTLTARVVRHPVPPKRPVGPSKPKTMAVSLMGGLVVGFVLMLLAEKLDHSFRSPVDVKATLNLPILGNIPVIVRRGSEPDHGGIWLSTLDNPRSIEAEAFRALRTVVGVTASARDTKALLVTSPNPNDGKTTMACNLSIVTAQVGFRVLLVDGDMRHPMVHKVFGVEGQRGLATYLGPDGSDWQSLVVPGPVDNLSVLPAGLGTTLPAELLGSTKFKRFIDEAREHYDYVFCDSPPILPVADPCLMAGGLDAAMLILTLGKHQRESAVAAKEALSAVQAELLGVVMNDVSLRSEYGHAYYRRYLTRYGYPGYYDPSDDSDGRGAGTADSHERLGPPALPAADA